MYAEQQGNLLRYWIKSQYDNKQRVHVGSLEYVRDFACGYGTENGDRIVIVKCNPKDVVSVPHDCNFQKVRTARYEVLGEYTGPLPEYVCDSCQALQEIDECDGDDDDGDYDGVHVTVKTFQEWYSAKSFVKNDQCSVVSKFSCDSFDSPLLEDFVRKALDANLGVQVIDQDGVDVTEDLISKI